MLRLALDPQGSDRMHGSIFCALLDEAMTLTGADMGNCQVVDPLTGTLRIIASRGFDAPFLKFFEVVDRYDNHSSCGTALKQAQRIVVPDIEQSVLFAGTESGEVLRAAGVSAVQSTPLLYREGHLAGMISTHWRSATRPSENRLRRLDAAIYQVRDAIAAEHRVRTINAVARNMIANHGAAAAATADQRSRSNFDKGAAVFWAEVAQSIREITAESVSSPPRMLNADPEN